MKKLFAGLVAVLALAPVVANAASYTAGQYVNFAGTAEDAQNFRSENYDQWILDNSGVGTLYIEDTTHTDNEGNKYLKVMSLVNNQFSEQSIFNGNELDLSAGSFIKHDFFGDIAKEVNKPYGYSSNGTDVDITIATKEEVMKLLGVSAVNENVAVQGDIGAAFNMLLDGQLAGTYYFFTNTKDGEDKFFAVEVVKTDTTVTSIKFVSTEAKTTKATVIPVLEMNSAYVCSGETKEEYACYECPSDNNKTILSWFKKGSQAANCKEVDKPKSKCATSPKTGVDSYLIPSAIVLGVCGIVLTVLKRKDAFKAI